MEHRGEVHHRKKRIKAVVIMILFLTFAFAVTSYVSVNLNSFKGSIEGYVDDFGYWGVLGLSFIVDFLEQPIGPDLPISAAVIFGLNPMLVVLFAVIGSFASSIINFYIGHGILSHRIRALCNVRDSKHNYCRLFTRHGRLALFLASITPVPWVAFCWLAGSFNLKFREFVFYGLIPRALRFYAVAMIVWYFKVALV